MLSLLTKAVGIEQFPKHGYGRQNDRVDLNSLRLIIYRTFADTGLPPETAVMADRLGLDPGAIVLGLRQLAQMRHLVIDEQDRILMAHPFSSLPMGFAVMGTDTLWWGGCAWDSFALPNLMPNEGEVLISTRCPACSSPHAWNVGSDGPPQGDQVVHFQFPTAEMWDDVVHTCRHQQIFCSIQCVDVWLARIGRTRGYVMDLATLWRLARHWYDGRLDRDYVRREPSAAKEYFRGVGLSGSFWGLPHPSGRSSAP